jgi:hypothetical protein
MAALVTGLIGKALPDESVFLSSMKSHSNHQTSVIARRVIRYVCHCSPREQQVHYHRRDGMTEDIIIDSLLVERSDHRVYQAIRFRCALCQYRNMMNVNAAWVGHVKAEIMCDPSNGRTYQWNMRC